MGKTITTRLPDKFVIGLKNIADKENLDTSAVIRKLLARAIEEWKKEYAVENYKKGEFSLGQAAQFAEISIWEFIELIKQKKISLNYDEEELEEELKAIKWKQ